MTRRTSRNLVSISWLAAFAVFACIGCGSGERTEFINIGTAPAAGSFHPVGSAMASAINDNLPEGRDWQAQAKGTKGSQENIRLLAQGELELALSNASITYFAARGESGWNKKYDVRAVMTLAPNVAMFVTRADSGIRTMDDLRGKNVVTGPPGAGFEMFVGPILEAHNLSFDDFNKKEMGQGDAVSALGDGTADVAFLGGSLPTPSLSQACNSMDIHFIPFDDAAIDELIGKYEFFESFRDLTADDYTDIVGTYRALNVGSMHLITSASADEQMIYEITKLLFEKLDGDPDDPNSYSYRDKHGSLKSVSFASIQKDTGVEFHPGAKRFFEEEAAKRSSEANTAED